MAKQSLKSKLGIKDGDVLLLINEPDEYSQKVGLNSTNSIIIAWDQQNNVGKANFIHVFVRSIEELSEKLFTSIDIADEKCMVWISWEKGSSSKKEIKINRDQIRSFILSNSNWVDTKVCSFDDTWSGLKFLRRVK